MTVRVLMLRWISYRTSASSLSMADDGRPHRKKNRIGKIVLQYFEMAVL